MAEKTDDTCDDGYVDRRNSFARDARPGAGDGAGVMTAPPALSLLAEARRHRQSLIAELRWLGRREWELMEQLRVQEAMIEDLDGVEER